MTTTEAEPSDRARELVMYHWMEAWDRSAIACTDGEPADVISEKLQAPKPAQRDLLAHIAHLEARVSELVQRVDEAEVKMEGPCTCDASLSNNGECEYCDAFGNLLSAADAARQALTDTEDQP